MHQAELTLEAWRHSEEVKPGDKPRKYITFRWEKKPYFKYVDLTFIIILWTFILDC